MHGGLRLVEPALGLVLVVAAERHQVGAMANVVDGDEAVRQHQHGVGHVGAVLVGGAAVGLQLVAEVADEPAEQAWRLARGRLDRALGDLAVEHVEDRAPLERRRLVPVHLHRPRLDLAFEHAAVLAGAGAEVGALREPRRRVGAVEPEGVLLVGEQPFKERLGRGLAGDRAHPQLRVRGGDLARSRVARGRRRTAGRAAARRFTALGEGVEVAHQGGAVVGGDRLGMELHSPHRPAAVFDPHHHAVVGPGADVAVGVHAGDRERVVADDREPLRDVLEETAAFVEDAAEAPVHRLGSAADVSVEGLPQPLVAEADAEHRDLAFAEDVVADAEVVPAPRRPRPGREHDGVEVPAR